MLRITALVGTFVDSIALDQIIETRSLIIKLQADLI